MPDLFSYTDFRTYLGDYYTERKAAFPYFSYRSFSDKIGFKSKDFIYRVINKGVRISQSSIVLISAAIGHTPREARYFEALVQFNQSRTAREREFFLSQLTFATQSSGSKAAAPRTIGGDELLLFSEWPLTAIRSLLEMVEIGNDNLTSICKLLNPPITLKQARSAIRKLEKLGFISKDDQGFYRPVDKALVTGDEVANVALVRFYLESFKLAAKAVESLPRTERHISGVTLGISRASYSRIVDIINKARADIAAIADEDTNPEQVFQLQVVLFPMSAHVRKGDTNAPA